MMTDRELFEKALKAMSQREGLTQEERKRRCGELLVQAQYMDPEEYLRWMNDSTKRPWVGLTKEEAKEISMANRPYVVDMIAALEARLKEKNT